MFWVYLKILSVPKSLRTLKANFEEADGLGISCWNQNVAKYRQEWSLIWRISFTTFSKNYIIPKRLQILVSYAMFFGSTGFPFFNQSECTARQCCIAIGRTFRKLVLKNLHCLGFKGQLISKWFLVSSISSKKRTKIVWFHPKNDFRSFFWGNRRHHKVISKLTDL